MRIGIGYDIHRLTNDRRLIIGGVEIPYEKGLLGHSDADVLAHAITDSLFGALALGDIGMHFPDTDEKYKGADSMALLKEACRIIAQNGYCIVNIDANIIAEKPKMMPYIMQMRKNIAEAIGADVADVSVKARTNEKQDAVGNGEAIVAQAVCLLKKITN